MEEGKFSLKFASNHEETRKPEAGQGSGEEIGIRGRVPTGRIFLGASRGQNGDDCEKYRPKRKASRDLSFPHRHER